MKLIKALNGDWINVAQASSFNVANFGTRAVVFARIGNTSYELFQSLSSTSNPDPTKFLDWDSDIPNPDYVKQAESFLEELFNKLGEVLSTPANEVKSVFLMDPVYSWILEVPVDSDLAAKLKEATPKKRAPRKAKEQDND